MFWTYGFRISSGILPLPSLGELRHASLLLVVLCFYCHYYWATISAMKHILIAIAAVLLVGCASTKSLNFSTISIGMNKQQVIALKGEPFRVAAMDGLEYFIYRGFDKELFKPNGFSVYEAFIRFKDGKVDAYGRLDDFDSTRHKELLIKKAEGK